MLVAALTGLWGLATPLFANADEQAHVVRAASVARGELVGKTPRSTYFTHVRKAPRGTRFSSLHATVQAWQPMHRRWSITNP